jgi:hypothetical protein
MICNILGVLFCFNPLGIGGAITAGIALGRCDTDVQSARKLVNWGWGLLAAAVVTTIIFWIIYIVGLAALFGSGIAGSTDGGTL